MGQIAKRHKSESSRGILKHKVIRCMQKAVLKPVSKNCGIILSCGILELFSWSLGLLFNSDLSHAHAVLIQLEQNVRNNIRIGNAMYQSKTFAVALRLCHRAIEKNRREFHSRSNSFVGRFHSEPFIQGTTLNAKLRFTTWNNGS